MNIAELVRSFEEGTLKEAEFRHPQHLLVALWYCDKYTERQAILRIKHGIMKYNLLFGVDQVERGYHETITMLYIKLAQKFLTDIPKDLSLDEKGKRFVEQMGENFSQSIQSYYSKDILKDRNAILHWVEPDVQRI